MIYFGSSSLTSSSLFQDRLANLATSTQTRITPGSPLAHHLSTLSSPYAVLTTHSSLSIWLSFGDYLWDAQTGSQESQTVPSQNSPRYTMSYRSRQWILEVSFKERNSYYLSINNILNSPNIMLLFPNYGVVAKLRFGQSSSRVFGS
jgi:hypothetical protein